MRGAKKIGDIFRVPLGDGRIRFFQFIAKDESNLNADVICVYKRHYNAIDKPLIEEIVNDSIDFYAYTLINLGVKSSIWGKYGSCPINTDRVSSIVFRDSLDYGHYPGRHFVSNKWVVWRINGPRVFVGKLPKEYHNAYIGMVCAPENIVQWLITDKFHHKYGTPSWW